MTDALPWRLRLLDSFQLSGPSGAITVTSRKAVAIVAYLALQRDRAAQRDVVATLLWEDVDTAQARMNLRQAIAVLRRAGTPGEPLILADLSTLRLTSSIEIDTARFDALESGDDDDRRAAADLYQSDPLAGFTLRDAPAFNEWLAITQAHWRQRMISILLALIERADGVADGVSAGAVDRNVAVAAGLRLLAIDPYNEAAHRALMRTYVRQGRSALALAQYRSLSDLLRRELLVAPEAETQQLYRTVQDARRERRDPSPPYRVLVPVDAVAEESEAIATLVADRPARIAVVDDEPALREAIASYLRGQGFEAVECSGGAELDSAFADGAIDLVLLDVTMPGEDGFEIARRLGSGIPKIMLTARADVIDRVVGLELGADDYIAKPFQLREVLARVRAVLRRSGGGRGSASGTAPPRGHAAPHG